MKIKYLCAACMALILSIGMFSPAAFAYTSEAPAETIQEQSEKTVPQSGEPMKPLTPDGNLTLVDDEGNTPKAGKQFITVVTKTGNYFYLIIDRDDEGKETVHFLNQVDEADLMKLADEGELEQFAPIEEVEPEPALEPEPDIEAQKSEPEPEKKPNVLSAVLSILLLAGGGSFLAFKKLKGKNAEKAHEKPDPDADYVDEEDYGYDEDTSEPV